MLQRSIKQFWQTSVILIMLLLSSITGFSFNKELIMKKRILFVLTSHGEIGNTGEKTGFWLSEASHPWAAFKEAGYDIDFVSPQGGMPPIDGNDLKDPENAAFMADAKVKDALAHTKTPSSIDYKAYDAIFYVGGHGTMWDFPGNKDLAQIAAKIYEQGGIVSAVCHGPAGLLNIKLSNGDNLLKGKRVTGFTNSEETVRGLAKVVPFLLEDELKARGAQYVGTENWADHIEVDGRLITGQNPASAKSVAKAVIKALESK